MTLNKGDKIAALYFIVVLVLSVGAIAFCFAQLNK
jgi:hypothetical protein